MQPLRQYSLLLIIHLDNIAVQFDYNECADCHNTHELNYQLACKKCQSPRKISYNLFINEIEKLEKQFVIPTERFNNCITLAQNHFKDENVFYQQVGLDMTNIRDKINLLTQTLTRLKQQTRFILELMRVEGFKHFADEGTAYCEYSNKITSNYVGKFAEILNEISVSACSLQKIKSLIDSFEQAFNQNQHIQQIRREQGRNILLMLSDPVRVYIGERIGKVKQGQGSETYNSLQESGQADGQWKNDQLIQGTRTITKPHQQRYYQGKWKLQVEDAPLQEWEKDRQFHEGVKKITDIQNKVTTTYDGQWINEQFVQGRLVIESELTTISYDGKWCDGVFIDGKYKILQKLLQKTTEYIGQWNCGDFEGLAQINDAQRITIYKGSWKKENFWTGTEEITQKKNQHKQTTTYKQGSNINMINNEQFSPIQLEYKKCTDVWCLVLFIIFNLCLGAIAYYAILTGTPEIVSMPRDPDHRVCGVDIEVKDFPYIYFANPNQKYLYVTTCVKTCPSVQHINQANTLGNIANTNKGIKHRVVIPTTAPHHLSNISSTPLILECAVNSIVKSCAQNSISPYPEQVVLVYDSQPFMDFICLPTSQILFNQVSSILNVQEVYSLQSDLLKTKLLIAYSIVLSLILTLLVYFFAMIYPKEMTQSFIFLFIVLLVGCGIFYQVIYLIANPIIGGQHNPNPENIMTEYLYIEQVGRLNNFNNQQLYSIIVFYVLACIFIVRAYLILVEMDFSNQIIDNTHQYFKDNFLIILLPFMSLLIILLYLIFWFYVAVLLFSSGTTSPLPKQIPFGQFRMSNYAKIFGLIHIFGLFWNLSFVSNSVEFIASGSASFWYVQYGRRNLPKSNKNLVYQYFRYRLGTVALSSFLQVSGVLIRSCVQCVCRKTKQHNVTKTSYKFLEQICFNNIEEQQLDMNAYIICNLQGSEYFKAYNNLLMRRSQTVYFSGIIVSEARAFIALISALICYFYITQIEKQQHVIAYPVVPSLLCAIVGFFIGSSFMGILGVVYNAIAQAKELQYLS